MRYFVVANPEALVVKQTRRIIEALRGYDITLHGIIINRVIKHPDSQSFRTLQEMQEAYLADLLTLAHGLPVAMVPFSLKEIKGKKALKEAGEGLLKELNLYAFFVGVSWVAQDIAGE